MPHICHQEIAAILALFAAGIGVTVGYLTARIRCWWLHFRKRCPSCRTGRVVTTLERKHWKWGDADRTELQIAVSAVLPVNTCTACGFEYEDWRAEKIRDAAVNAHLNADRRIG